MTTDTSGFREFEQAGWADEGLARQYAAWFGSLTTQCVPALLDAVGAGPGVRLLDVACGPGYVAAAAAQRGAEVSGGDFSAAMVVQAQAAYPGISFGHCDAEALPHADASFDAVTINFGLLHLAQPDRALQQAHRVLRPGGRLAYTVWVDPAGSDGLRVLMGSLQAHGNLDVPLPPGPSFFRFADAVESQRSALEAGFTNVQVAVVPQVWRLAAPDGLIAAFRDGGVRVGALLRGQTPEQAAAISAAVAAGLAPYRQADGFYHVPMPCVLTSATRP